MKRFLIILSIVIVLYLGIDYAYYHEGWYLPVRFYQDISVDAKVMGDKIFLKQGDESDIFQIKGVDMGSGIPGEWSTDFAISKKTYLRWFKLIQMMGANTIRIYTVQNADFYEAFYEYNSKQKQPLYLIQGVWVNDYIQNSHVDAYDETFWKAFQKDCYTMVNVIHGNCKLKLGEMASSGSGNYRKDISPWVIGYILGVEWEDVTVSYTNEKFKDNLFFNSYEGTYMYTTEDAEPFEAMLANVGDHLMEYETNRYRQQRLIAFSNWPTTDPFDYSEEINRFFMKCAKVDVEHIKTTDKVLSGQFASYHVYPYYPDYLSYMDEWDSLGIKNGKDFLTENGKTNTYRAYLTALTQHHTMPVVISEFGVSTGRGMAQRDQNTGRNQGNMSESGQGQAIVDCYEDIMESGCAGCCIFAWQDEWFKRTWNTMYAVDLKFTPYWSDYQTNEQYFGLLSFDPGKKKSICYVNGDVSEWTRQDVLDSQDDMTLSMKYDEKFVYFYVHKPGLDLEKDVIYIPIDTTPNSGSTWCKGIEQKFDRPVDFLITINGKDNSRIQVQEYYESLRANYSENAYGYNTYYREFLPTYNSAKFVNVEMILQIQKTAQIIGDSETIVAETYETGKLTYGNADPKSEDFNSLADFMADGDNLEIKLPWQILNFSNPSEMEIHDDYYNGNYGVDYTKIDQMHVGIGSKDTKGPIHLATLPLVGWGKNPTYHERLKSSYYMVQELWTNQEGN